ncbi:DUF4114 domain-containing protein [Nodosilinea sp. PGN35]|uniref:DUF4114 domain-containing protein n=1 Tax=Nodosilinea sp. PGN35 TaxID=3020489 RepID=UPI0023B2B3BC|nr:DUF4114 domain-containing protein [Nodosilinea sp. TSF1-S3]MDF0369756.1 DUF4114 domain-containing protein [Nodosilinea sp. TSF1-S3]
MSLSVGPIQSYVPGSTWFDLAKYSSLGTQERVSLNLSESNLWLIDSSDLYLPYNYAPRIAFINEGAGYQSPISMTANGATSGAVTVFSNLSGSNSILPSANAPLRIGDWVQVSEVLAGTQLNFSVKPNGVVNANATSLSTDYRLNPTSAYNPNSPIFWAAYADPKATKPLLLLAYEDIVGRGSDNDFNDGILAVDVGEENFWAIFTRANLGQDATINLKDAQPVPLEMHSALGLLVIGAIALMRRGSWWKQTLFPIGTQTPNS